MALLQQLGGGGAASAGGEQPCQLPDALVATLAPSSDPMRLFRSHMGRPTMPEAATMTPPELAAHLRELSLEISVQLHVLSSLPPVSQDATLARLHELWDRYAARRGCPAAATSAAGCCRPHRC